MVCSLCKNVETEMGVCEECYLDFEELRKNLKATTNVIPVDVHYYTKMNNLYVAKDLYEKGLITPNENEMKQIKNLDTKLRTVFLII